MSEATKSPTCWTRPSDVMRNLKAKKRALQARMDQAPQALPRSLGILQESSGSSSLGFGHAASDSSSTDKRNNPFKTDLSKRFKRFEFGTCDFDASNDNTLFQLLNQSSSSSSQVADASIYNSFSNFLEKISASHQERQPQENKNSLKHLPVDWSLKSRVRFFSKKQFTWNKTLKTLEEASGTTGFSRCLDLRSDDCGASPSLDTGPNAQFHQCCLVWQHPFLPWLSLFPRSGVPTAARGPHVPLDAAVRDCLYKTWRESFRSLLQLVRSHQCPYFYVCANKFTCLFRAAGVGGVAEIHALISPTTSGFRNLLSKDEVVFSMPLRKEERRAPSAVSTPTSGSPDAGYDTQDSAAAISPGGSDGEASDPEEGDEGEEEAAEWLQSMGVAAKEIKRLSTSQGKIAAQAAAASRLDLRPCSLVQVEKDEEVQALFNLLVNCQSVVATTGPLAGVPPTLLAPVAFHGATLRSLKASQRVVTLSGEQFQCVEVQGPILPHALRELCSLLEAGSAQFSASCTTVEHSRALSQLPCPAQPPLTDIFSRENLRDCGLRPTTLHALCRPGPHHVLETFKYTEDTYHCQD